MNITLISQFHFYAYYIKVNIIMNIIREETRNSIDAKKHIDAFESLLEMRILLQKPIELVNKLPVFNDLMKDTETKNIKDSLDGVRDDLKETLNSLLSIQDMQISSNKNNKKKKRSSNELNLDTTSADIWNHMQDNLKRMRPSWKKSLDLWHGRSHYGSEATKQKLKFFNQTGIFEQIEAAMQDESRVLERSRIRMELSQRPDRHVNKNNKIDDDDINEDEDDSGSHEEQQEQEIYDTEVYDDRGLYSVLLKTYITNSAGRSGDGLGKEDLEALRRYRQKKSLVDRKASKGRKIRYTIHSKLENFMFPEPGPISSTNIDRLFASMFQ